MEIFNDIAEKLLNIMPGGLYGVLSIIIGLIGDFLAIIYFPGYNILDNMASDLGIGNGGIFFNLGMIFSGLVAIPFYVYLSKILKTETVNEAVRRYFLYFAIISCITFALIGVFPSIESLFIIFFLHGLCALISWISAILYLVLFSFLILRDQRFSKFKAYLGLVPASTITIFLFTWQPLIEWSISFTIILWIIVIASYTLYKKF